MSRKRSDKQRGLLGGFFSDDARADLELSSADFVSIVKLSELRFGDAANYANAHANDCNEYRQVWNYGRLILGAKGLHSDEADLIRRYAQFACGLYDDASRGQFKATEEIRKIEARNAVGDRREEDRSRLDVLRQREIYFGELVEGVKAALPASARLYAAPDDECRGAYRPPELK